MFQQTNFCQKIIHTCQGFKLFLKAIYIKDFIMKIHYKLALFRS